MKVFFIAILLGLVGGANSYQDQESYIRMIRKELQDNAAKLQRDNPGVGWNDPAVTMDTVGLRTVGLSTVGLCTYLR